MTIKDIKKAINNVLITNGRIVYSSETDEGFKKPAYFVNIYPVSIQKTSAFFEEVQLSVAMEMAEDSKLTGTAGEFNFKIKKIFSRGQIKLAKAIKKGNDVRSQFIGKLDDPDAYGSERIVLENCWFSDLTLMAFEGGKVGEEEFSGGFTDFNFPDLVSAR